MRYVPKSAGVYLLGERTTPRMYAYVGQADNLEKRLLEHLSPNEPNRCIRDLVSKGADMTYATVSRQSERDCIERALYDHYKPRCNEVAPPGEPCSVNYPE